MTSILDLSANECVSQLTKAFRALGIDWDGARQNAKWCHEQLYAGNASALDLLDAPCTLPEPADTPAGRVQVDADAWQRVADLAFKTYVPESESSRLGGAGAGLTDND